MKIQCQSSIIFLYNYSCRFFHRLRPNTTLYEKAMTLIFIYLYLVKWHVILLIHIRIISLYIYTMTTAKNDCNFTNTYHIAETLRKETTRIELWEINHHLPARLPKLPRDGRCTSERAVYPTSILQNSRI